LKDILFEGCRKDQIAQRLSEVAFIVFNYDRCIEQFLLHTLRNYYNLTEAEAAKLVNLSVIRHPYGVVGRLPWQGGNAPFGVEAKTGQLLDIADQVQTFTEEIKDKAALAEIRLLVSSAPTVVFLGFAFHKQNLSLLDPAGHGIKVGRVFATAFDFSSNDRVALKNRITALFQGRPNYFQIENMTCRHLFDNNRLNLVVT
jgi:hypothetical protein